MVSWPTGRDWIFSLKAFAAAMLALFIALYLGLPRPYWAMASVYIVAHPLTGATRSKALYRVLGTLLGAAASVAIVPPLVNAPVLLMAAVALWTGILLYVALLHRTPRSYVFMLAAYTLPMVALPSVSDPGGVFDIAVARAEEICLGILCASIIGSTIFPAKVATVLGQKSGQWLADAALWATDMLSAHLAAKVSRHHSRHRLAADILALDQLISHLSYDAESAARVKHAQELRGRMTMLLPVLSSLASVVDALHQHAAGIPQRLSRNMALVSAWISAGAQAPLPALQLSPDAPIADAGLEPGSAGPDWHAALAATAEGRLRELMELWQDCVSLQRRIGAAAPEGDWAPVFQRWGVGAARHYDHGMLLFSTATTALAIFSMGMVWIWTGWADGAGAVALGAVSCCFFAAMDEPAPMIRSFFRWNVVCLVLATIYLFVVLPNAHDFEMLVLMFAVPYLIIGVMMAQPRLALIAMPLAVVTANDIGIQGAYNADFNAFFNGNVAGIAGILFALVWTLVARPFGTKAAVRRLVRASWGDIARNATGREPGEHAHLRARMLDRLAQLVPRLAASEDETTGDGFTEVRVELSTLALQRELSALAPEHQHSVRRVLQGIASYYQARLDARADTPPQVLRDRLGKAIRKVASRADHASREAFAALVEMHVALFSAAPAAMSAAGAQPAGQAADPMSKQASNKQ
ncbi:FUSC family protein [Cupriavidus sp. D39]|uniref:FUSC family protein n=1 Tax=Cupriavidus sp. D39 TaxID=2997877 RepID=UPI0022707765|nr:FUSC family protein [Cupriavidus sp. D39]MCY0857799.1 FUSC family protein [Cupriavidus sp. D39]